MSSPPSVKLVHFSQNANCDSLQRMIAYCAKVSNPSNQWKDATDEKLLMYLIQHKHWSPFEMVSVCVEIETTRDIARQILRHRSFSFQEFSQRYAIASLGFQQREARLQDHRNRQNSIELDTETEEATEIVEEWKRRQESVTQVAQDTYEWAIQAGIAKEQARVVLPEGLTTTRMYVHGTMRSWIHYIELRSANGTQKEHREVAVECARVISAVFPLISEFV
jgi:thymidylate synthase (FAD)